MSKPMPYDRLYSCRGRATERSRIKRAQRGALRCLLGLIDALECGADYGLPGCDGSGKHAEDCAVGDLLGAIKALRAATKEPRR